jgi:uncharacterized protein YprB with RNaseH-like and TPR domain
MSDLKERLLALRRQGGIAVTRTIVNTDVRVQLRKLLGTRDIGCTPLPAPAGIEIAPGVRLVEERRFDGDAAPIFAPDSDAIAPIERERLVCFDTETTGLAGGVGTKAFMIGTTCWRDGVFVMRQYYLTALVGEPAMLRQFADDLPADPVFVSYNGKSYDVPLLKGRFRLNRQAHPFENRQHIDLLHPVRRRYRGYWENCRLQTIEREVLKIVREDDLPGSEAPAAWLLFLRGQSNRALARVIKHNREDLLSLTRLLIYLASTPSVYAANKTVGASSRLTAP